MSMRSQRMIQSFAGVVVTCVVLSSVEGWPQEPLPAPSAVEVGSKVRLLAPSVVGSRLQGVVTGVDEGALLVSADERPPTKVPLQSVTRLEVSTGRHRQTLRGMLIGAGVGAVVIGPAYHADAERSHCSNALVPCTTSVAGAEAFGILAGAAWGAAIGALIKTDHWQEVPLGAVRVSLAPGRQRGFRWALAFAY